MMNLLLQDQWKVGIYTVLLCAFKTRNIKPVTINPIVTTNTPAFVMHGMVDLTVEALDLLCILVIFSVNLKNTSGYYIVHPTEYILLF